MDFLDSDNIDGHNYAYYVTDLRNNDVIAELPLQNVAYDVKLSAVGEFSGDIIVNDETAVYDLRTTTFPGRTGLYVVRDGEPVWGGMIWKRKYDGDSRKLTILASTFESYLGHRLQLIDKTYTNTDQLDMARWLLSNSDILDTLQASVSTKTSPRKRDRTFNGFEFNTVLD